MGYSLGHDMTEMEDIHNQICSTTSQEIKDFLESLDPEALHKVDSALNLNANNKYPNNLIPGSNIL